MFNGERKRDLILSRNNAVYVYLNLQKMQSKRNLMIGFASNTLVQGKKHAVLLFKRIGTR